MGLGGGVPNKSEYREKVDNCPKCGASRGLFRIRYQQSGEQDWLQVHCICWFGWKEQCLDNVKIQVWIGGVPHPELVTKAEAERMRMEYYERKAKKDEDDYAG